MAINLSTSLNLPNAKDFFVKCAVRIRNAPGLKQEVTKRSDSSNAGTVRWDSRIDFKLDEMTPYVDVEVWYKSGEDTLLGRYRYAFQQNIVAEFNEALMEWNSSTYKGSKMTQNLDKMIRLSSTKLCVPSPLGGYKLETQQAMSPSSHPSVSFSICVEVDPTSWIEDQRYLVEYDSTFHVVIHSLWHCLRSI
eukprot:SAG31_NODE_2713_length_5205_cov_2.328241_2_plen_192_part_00